MLISSQVPVGFTRRAGARLAVARLRFAYSPENLRLGKAIDVLPQARARHRRAAATRHDRAALAERCSRPFCGNIEWMSVESAEMTKHALNAFLATSVTFINELARLCEAVGADAKEVERGLKSEARIGPKAPTSSPGAAFAGGTLARDVRFLIDFGDSSEHRRRRCSTASGAATRPTRTGSRDQLDRGCSTASSSRSSRCSA